MTDRWQGEENRRGRSDRDGRDSRRTYNKKKHEKKNKKIRTIDIPGTSITGFLTLDGRRRLPDRATLSFGASVGADRLTEERGWAGPEPRPTGLFEQAFLDLLQL